MGGELVYNADHVPPKKTVTQTWITATMENQFLYSLHAG